MEVEEREGVGVGGGDEGDFGFIFGLVGAEDEVYGVEFERSCDDLEGFAIFWFDGVEDGTEGLADGGFGDDAVGLSESEQIGG